MIEATVTDPVNGDISGADNGEFNAMWEKIGVEVKQMLQAAPSPDIAWCNIGVTHNADTIGENVLHRTVSIK